VAQGNSSSASADFPKPASPLLNSAENHASPPVVLNMLGADWEQGLEAEAMSLLVAGRTDVWDVLVHRFEARLIQTALVNTRGRRIEAAHKLGIGRNTITRKIQELGLDD
jgi:two-component system nitrogen regulation response regulator GlnG